MALVYCDWVVFPLTVAGSVLIWPFFDTENGKKTNLQCRFELASLYTTRPCREQKMEFQNYKKTKVADKKDLLQQWRQEKQGVNYHALLQDACCHVSQKAVKNNMESTCTVCFNILYIRLQGGGHFDKQTKIHE
jgi:hypothetical protein